MVPRAVARIVDLCRRGALPIALIALVLTGALGWFAINRLSVNTDTNDLISAELPWRKREAEFDKLFPQNVDLLAVVIDAPTADQAEDAAKTLSDELKEKPELFRTVRRPEGSEFFSKNGLLFLSVEEVQEVADKLIAAQPLLGTLAADPSVRGVFDSLSLALEGVSSGEITLDSLNGPIQAIADAVQSAVDGRPKRIAWQSLLTGRQPSKQELRRFILVQPVLDYSALQPGARATAAVRQRAAELGFTPENGIRVRLTGPVALSDEEFATVSEGAGGATILSLGLVCVILFLALRSFRIIVAILATLIAGLLTTAAFAVVSVGALNLISVAFAVLFVGIAVDFSIQFSVRYRDERYHHGSLAAALRATASNIGGPLALAAATTAVGFYAFVPTNYSGVSELGVIAGTSMVIAFALNVTLLPALLTLLRPAGEPHPVGYAWAAGVDRFLVERRRVVLIAAAALAGLGVALAPSLRFDFNPLNLKDPKTESVATLFDLMADPTTTPYTLDALAPNVEAAAQLSDRIGKLPEVSQTVSLASFVPDDQQPKLAIINDLAMLLGPTLSPPQTLPPPNDDAILAATRGLAEKLHRALSGRTQGPGAQLAAALDRADEQGTQVVPRLKRSIMGGLVRRLRQLRLSLEAGPVKVESIPADLRQSWVAGDGRARVEIFPASRAGDNESLERFVNAVRTVTPDISGTPISIQESGRTVVDAFVRAGSIAIVSISLLLWLVLRHVRDVLLVLAPLTLAALLTVATCVTFDIAINYANIICLPLLLGIGVSFDIYFVMNWRAGRMDPLQSATARAVLFSAMTTVTAFGSLALSSHPGTAEMGLLLTIALGYTLLCTLFFLPALTAEPVRLTPAASGGPRSPATREVPAQRE